ncbi:hypothetical protein AXG89_25560 (plasmid) [Burkholderia sp. PAMC 26561]|nr:hypothetical protein AXG89_25560 [Burkholderia sp. PAMC 26561]
MYDWLTYDLAKLPLVIKYAVSWPIFQRRAQSCDHVWWQRWVWVIEETIGKTKRRFHVKRCLGRKTLAADQFCDAGQIRVETQRYIFCTNSVDKYFERSSLEYRCRLGGIL